MEQCRKPLTEENRRRTWRLYEWWCEPF